MLFKCLFFLTPFRTHRKGQDLLALIKLRLQAWKHLSHWASASDCAYRSPPPQSSCPSSNARRAHRAVEVGLFGKVMQALTSHCLVSPSRDIWSKLLAMHPRCPPPALPPLPSFVSPPLSTPPPFSAPSSSPYPPPFSPPLSPPSSPLFASLSHAPSISPLSLSFFSCPSSHSYSCFRSQGCEVVPKRYSYRSLRSLRQQPERSLLPTPPCRAQATLLQLKQFFSFLSSGSCPHSVVPHLCGATFLASLKKSGGTCSIVIGEVLRRLTSMCLSSLVLPQVKRFLPPH
uniref:Uncharacterized protein n=1 Tax=Amphimedon queenslandica TaxID=400682 RepID=A0A1X7V304_AMPQE